MAKRKAKAGSKAPELKSRFSGLIKMTPGGEALKAETVVVEGENYLEFDKLPGVYFSAKLFA